MNQHVSPSQVQDRTGEEQSLAAFFTSSQWLCYLIVVLLGIGFRLLFLDQRPIHHDESLHIMYGAYFIDRPEELYYKYDPMLHGPFLYHFLRLVFSSFGISVVVARAPTALIGCLFIFVPLVFRRYFSRNAVMALTAAYALSPMMIYWSRFLRHDLFVVCGMLLLVFGVLRARNEQKSFFVLLGLTLQFCVKENAYVTTSLILAYLLFEYFVDLLFLKERRSLLRSMFSHSKRYPFQVLFSALLCFLVYAYFYTSGFRYFGKVDGGSLEQYFGAILDGVYRKSLGYWFEHHSMERIKGPFLFHFYMLSFYESAFIVAFFGQLFLFFKQARPLLRSAGVLALFIGLSLLLVHFRYPLNDTWLWRFCKLKNTLDLVGLVFLSSYGVIITFGHLLQGERPLAFWGFIFSAFFFTYSYLGEKVPWLSIYPFVAGLIYLTLYYDDYFRRYSANEFSRVCLDKTFAYLGLVILILGIVFFVEDLASSNERIRAQDMQNNVLLDVYFLVAGLGFVLVYWLNRYLRILGRYNLPKVLFIVLVVFNARAAIQTNFVYAGRASELISQVHTTHEFHDIVLRVRDEIVSRKKGYRLRMLALGDAVWPMSAYMVGVREYSYIVYPNEGLSVYEYIFQSYKPKPGPKKAEQTPAEKTKSDYEVPEGYRTEKIKQRGWWLPDYRRMTLKRFLNYAINHQPWNTVGYSYLFFSTKLD
jgi:uncharacterized protein (TIGR03663 family)